MRRRAPVEGVHRAPAYEVAEPLLERAKRWKRLRGGGSNRPRPGDAPF
jgi:hypothetical protein